MGLIVELEIGAVLRYQASMKLENQEVVLGFYLFREVFDLLQRILELIGIGGRIIVITR